MVWDGSIIDGKAKEDEPINVLGDKSGYFNNANKALLDDFVSSCTCLS